MRREAKLPDELKITGRTASYTYRTPGNYLLTTPRGVEVRVTVQGAQGGGGGARYSGGGHQGEGGGSIVRGGLGKLGENKESKWMRVGDVLEIEIGEGGKGGRGVEGLHGGKGADSWVQVEIRRIGLRARLRYISSELWSKASQWLTWQKTGVIVGIVAVIVTIIVATCG